MEIIQTKISIEIMGFDIILSSENISDILEQFNENIVYFAIDESGELWAFNDEPFCEGYNIWAGGGNDLNPIKMDKLKIVDVDWTKTCVGVYRDQLTNPINS